MNIKQNPCDPRNYRVTRRDSIKYIVLHYTGGNGDTDEENGAYFAGRDTGDTSAHYFVDEDSITQSVPDNSCAFHCGATSYKHPECRNDNAIGIEMCSDKDSSGNYIITPATVNNAVELTKYLMDKYGIDINHILRHYDVTGKNCLPLDVTELLSPDGWIPLAKLTPGNMIATYSPITEKMRFSPVLSIIEPYLATVYRVRKLEATANHNMLIRPNAPNSHKWRKSQFEGFFSGSKQWQIMGCADMFNNGLPLTDYELRLLTWIQGDGSYEDGVIRFHFSKKQKIVRLSKLLSDMKKDFSLYKQMDGTTKIDIRDSGKTFAWAESWLSEKQFTFKLLGMDKAQFEVFLEELICVDGSKENNSYFSMKKVNTDFVQALAAINGIRTLEYVQDNGLHVISFNNCNYYVITHKKDKAKKQSQTSTRETLVGCVTVEDGYILIRQNGQVSITGNCPAPFVQNESLWADFKLKLVGGVLDMALETWQKEGGQAALKALAEKGLVSNIENWNTESALAANVPAYLFWMMMDRLAEYKK